MIGKSWSSESRRARAASRGLDVGTRANHPSRPRHPPARRDLRRALRHLQRRRQCQNAHAYFKNINGKTIDPFVVARFQSEKTIRAPPRISGRVRSISHLMRESERSIRATDAILIERDLTRVEARMKAQSQQARWFGVCLAGALALAEVACTGTSGGTIGSGGSSSGAAG